MTLFHPKIRHFNKTTLYSTDDLEVEIKLSNTHVLGNDMSRLTIIFELHGSDVPSAMDAEDYLPFPWNGIKVDTFGLTYCDVHTLEQYRVVCTLRNHLIYARYKAWAFVENFGLAQIEQHWQFRTKEHISVAVASSVSPNGGANVRIESYSVVKKDIGVKKLPPENRKKWQMTVFEFF